MRSRIGAAFAAFLFVAAALGAATAAGGQTTSAVLSGRVLGDPTGVSTVRANLYEAEPDGSRGAFLRDAPVVDSVWAHPVDPGCYVVALVVPSGYIWAANRGTEKELEQCVVAGDDIALPSSTLLPVALTMPPVADFEPTTVTANSIVTTWSPVTEPGLTGYELSLDGQVVATGVVGESYTFTGLAPSRTHQLGIRATAGPGQTSELRTRTARTTPGAGDLGAVVGHSCDVAGTAEVTVELTNGTDDDVTFEIGGDGVDDRAPLLAAGEVLVVVLPTSVAGDGSVAIRVEADDVVLFDGPVALTCASAVARPSITAMTPGGATVETADSFDRPTVALAATATDPVGGGLVFQHRLETLDGQVVDQRSSTGPTWSPTIPAGYPDQVLAWTVIAVGTNGAASSATRYLDAVTPPPVLPACDPGTTEAITIDSHTDGEQVDTGESGTGTGGFVLAGTVTAADAVTIAVGAESVAADLAPTADPCVRTWSTEVTGAQSALVTFSATAPQGAVATVELDVVAAGADDLLLTPAYAATRDVDLRAVLAAFDPATGTVELTGDLTATLAVGHVIVDDGGAEPAADGFMRVIDTVAFDGSVTTVETHPALLTDVFRRAVDQPAASPARSGPEAIDVTFFGSEVSGSGNLEVSVDGNASIDSRMELDIDWVIDCGFLGCYPKPRLQYFLIEAAVELGVTADLTGTGSGTIDATLAQRDVQGPIFFVYGVPVTTALEIGPFIRASIQSAGVLEVSGAVRAGAGYEYVRDGGGRGAYEILETTGPTIDRQDFRALARVDVGAELELEVFIADAIGPTVSARPALTVTGDVQIDDSQSVLDWCTGFSLIELAIGGEIEVPILGIEIVELDHQFLEPPGWFYEVACGQIQLPGGPCGGDTPGAAPSEDCALVEEIIDRLESDDLGPRSRRNEVRNRNDLREVAIACLETAGSEAQARRFCLRGNVFFSGRERQTEATAHIADAQGIGFPSVLTFQDPPSVRAGWYYAPGSACGANNQEAQKIYVQNGGARGVQVDCDEYPFFATTAGYRPAGGTAPSIRPMSRRANRSSGSDLGRFANQCPTVKAASPGPYLVVPTENSVVTRSFWICEPINADAPEPDPNENEFIDSSPVITVDPPDGTLSTDTRIRVGVTDEGQESSSVTVDWVLRTVPSEGDPVEFASGTESVQPNGSFLLPELTEEQARSEIELEVTATDISGKSSRGLYRYNVGFVGGGECGEQGDVPVGDCLGLLDLYNATDGPNWVNNTNWLDFDAGVCTWFGVNCDFQGRVWGIRLADNGLAGPIPASVGNWTGLYELILDRNQITSVPPEIGNLAGLRSIGLERNQITSVPPEIANLTLLSFFDIGHNQLTELPPVGTLVELGLLWFDDNQISAMPDGIGNLTELWTLNFATNQVTELPPEIGNLASLRQLHGSGNQLTSLPDEFGQLTSLESIYFWNNQLTSLPAGVSDMVNLRYLELYSNELTSVPSVADLTNIWVLNVSRNNLTSLPVGVTNLTQMYRLQAGSNQITSLPADIGSLTALEFASLSSNEISSVPASIGDLPALERIWLSGNNLTSVPASIGNPPNLELLYLGGNRMSGDITPLVSGLTDTVQFFRISDGRTNIGNNCLTVGGAGLAAWLGERDRSWDECYTPPILEPPPLGGPEVLPRPDVRPPFIAAGRTS